MKKGEKKEKKEKAPQKERRTPASPCMPSPNSGKRKKKESFGEKRRGGPTNMRLYDIFQRAGRKREKMEGGGDDAWSGSDISLGKKKGGGDA